MSAGDTYQLWWQGTESLSLCGIPVTDHTTLIQGGKEMAGMEKLNDQLKCQIINRPNQDPRMPDNRVSTGSRFLNFLEILALHLTLPTWDCVMDLKIGILALQEEQHR